MLRGLTSISFFADDLEAARAWYTAVLGVEPYYVRSGYLESSTRGPSTEGRGF